MKIIKISIVTSLLITSVYAIESFNKVGNIFNNGKVTTQLKMMYAKYSQNKSELKNTYATATSAMLKYELAPLNGFNAGAAFNTAYNLDLATGDNDELNPELSSYKNHYTQLSEAYINYKYNSLNLRVGRQVIDTPLADSDDIRLIANTFEAYFATYELDNIMFTLGNLQKWQGVDTGLGYEDGVSNDVWKYLGDGGVMLGGVTYGGDNYELNTWYYDIPIEGEETKALYVDAAMSYELKKNISFHGAIQYLLERESKDSGVYADIYGAVAQLSISNFGLSIAYNKSKGYKGKRSFSGMGGGTLFTNMDTMILDEITEDKGARAIVAGLTYDIGDFNLFYAFS